MGRSRFRSRRTKTPHAKLKRTVWRIVGALVAFGFLVSLLSFWLITRNLPEPGRLSSSRAGSLVVLDKDGKIIHQLFKDKQHIQVQSDDIPKYLKQATVAIEDKDFYRHAGFDPLTIVRIPFNYIFRNGRVVGGSTLTQQLIKQGYLDSSRTITRKIKELVLATRIEGKLSKDEILVEYLNIAPYGGTYEGVGAAAQAYFDKKVGDLDLLECAILAGLPQAPSIYSPFVGQTGAWRMRTKDVLRRMLEDKYITKAQHDAALKQIITFTFANRKVSINAPHFVFYVRDEAEKIVGAVTMKQGVVIKTTLDEDLQKKAEQIVYDEVTNLKDYDVGNGAALVLDTKTGDMLSMVGSYDFNDEEYGKFNVVADESALRQPGSTLKPLLVASALEKKTITASSVIMDVKTAFPIADQADYVPVNYDGKFRGPVQVRFALGNSYNVPMVKLLAEHGLTNFLTSLESLGIKSLAPTQVNLSRLGLSVALGGGDIKMTELAKGYLVLARGGTKVEPSAILEIRDNNGKVLYKRPEIKVTKVLDRGVAFIVSHILSDNVARADTFGTNSVLVIPGKTVAVKTGTTNDKRDNWAVGYTKGVVVVAWVGNNDNSPMNQRIASGITGASPIWSKIMKEALSTYTDGIVDKPDNVIAEQVDPLAGGKPRDGGAARAEYFLTDTQPKEVSSVYQRVKISKNQSGKRANEKEISSGQYDEKDFIVFTEDDPVSTDGKNRWQEGINAWAAEQGDEKYKVPTETSDHSPAPTNTPAPTSAPVTPTSVPNTPTPHQGASPTTIPTPTPILTVPPLPTL
ncbi:transglycosylase domain-containing protein [Candidatus Woesebacteria bacterium]|nr:transglycosylase domain-containing protein [Candidatus Woesebacteria bacterium]